MSKTTPNTAHLPTAAGRRSMSGLLVAVAVVAAIGITVILNYVVYWQYRGLSPDTRSWVRYDLTSTRRYSLAPQSRNVIAEIDTPCRLVTMLGGETISGDQKQRVRDLVDEYGRASSLIEVRHIDLDTQPGERDKLLAEMDAMFAEDTRAVRAAIADGLAKIDRYTQLVDQIEARLKSIVDSDVKMRAGSVGNDRLTNLHSQYLRLQDQAEEVRAQRDELLGRNWQQRLTSPGGVTLGGAGQGASLPDYFGLMVEVQAYVDQLANAALPVTPTLANQVRLSLDMSRSQEAAYAAQDTLAYLIQRVPDFYKQIKPEVDPLLTVTAPYRYDEARAVLNDKPCVLLTSGGDARVLPAELLFRGSGATQQTDAPTNDLFVGEEQLTGALISIKLDPPPLIVFVRSNLSLRSVSAKGKNGERQEGVYDHVVKRLLNMDFEVAEWTNPPKDPPQPRPGQRVVWVTQPFLKPDLRNRESLDNKRKNDVAAFLQQRLAMGDSAMVMLSNNPDTAPELRTDKTADALIDLLAQFGIDAQVYQNASRLLEENEDPRRSKFTDEFLVRDWPDSAIVGEALDGIDTFLLAPMPIRLTPVPGVQQTPLAELTAPAMHVQRTVPDDDGSFTPEPDSARQRVLVGAAVQRGQSRMVTIGAATWALDEITSAAQLPDGTVGPGLADKPGARILYPGNSDLFVNCVCWLAHEEDLIAATPRTQDIRRIDTMSPATLTTYRRLLLGAMPGAIFAVGIGVWLMRRRA